MASVITYAAIEDAADALEGLKRQYLRRFGWTETCNTPGAFWLWRRDFSDVDARALAWWEEASALVQAEGRAPPSKPQPKGIITADTELAVSMTARTLDEQPEAQEEDDG